MVGLIFGWKVSVVVVSENLVILVGVDGVGLPIW